MDKMTSFKQVAKLLDKSLEICAVIMISLSVLLAFVSVILRYFYGVSYEVLTEISTYAIVYGVFVYIGPLIKQDEHIKMNILREIFQGKKLIIYIDILIGLLLIGVFGYLLYGGIIWSNSLLDMGTKTLSGGMLLFVPAIAIVIGMFIGLVYAILQMIIDIRSLGNN